MEYRFYVYIGIRIDFYFNIYQSEEFNLLADLLFVKVCYNNFKHLKVLWLCGIIDK